MSDIDLRIIVTRDDFRIDRTLGRVDLDFPGDGVGPLPFAHSCEDRDRGDGAAKVPGETAIPVGIYEIELYNSPKHGPDTPQLIGVKGYRHVQIHSGNKPEHTLGCLLFGLDRKDGEVRRSRQACDWLQQEIIKTIKARGKVYVEVRRAAGYVLA